MIGRRTFIVGSAAAIAGCAGGNNPQPICPPPTAGVWPNCITPPPPPPPPTSGAWNVGPVIGGRNYSPGMPAQINDRFDFPVGAPNPDHSVIPSVHYVTKPIRLAGRSRIHFAFTVVGNGPFKSTELPEQMVPYVCLHFQRNGDNWSGAGQFEPYRWWSNDQVTLASGDGALDVPLTRDAWVSVMNQANASDFANAINDPCCVGFTFGGAGGKGHGAYSDTPGSQFIVRWYDVY